ncbi:unnamed protein product [Rhizophagus irregularis]|nr:unnamed protein product [Rhizophagus irregularis]
MACILDPKIDSNGQHLEWDPATIPSTKPFMHICTTFVPLHMTSFEDMNFVKTRSSIFHLFTKILILFTLKLDTLKAPNEAVYLSSEKNTETTYAQVDVKIIDFDVKSSQQNTSTFSPQSTSMKSVNNTFTKRRFQILNP